jgi:urease accessory protein
MPADMELVSSMPHALPSLPMLTPSQARKGWQARLALGYAARNGETLLVRREHAGPLTVQKALYPEGRAVCHTLILHPPSGIAGGDHLEFDIEVRQGAHALLTMPGATRWYRSAGNAAGQRVGFRVERDAVLEWLPPETIFFNDANAGLHNDIALEAGARYIGWEILCFGRTASGERFADGQLRQQTQIRIAGEPVWDERLRLAGGSPLMQAAAGLGGATVSATLLAAGVKLPAEILARCREHTVQGGARAGVSAIDTLFVARYLGDSSEQAREYFVSLWRELRPLLAGRAAVTPRIWNT